MTGARRSARPGAPWILLGALGVAATAIPPGPARAETAASGPSVQAFELRRQGEDVGLVVHVRAAPGIQQFSDTDALGWRLPAALAPDLITAWGLQPEITEAGYAGHAHLLLRDLRPASAPTDPVVRPQANPAERRRQEKQILEDYVEGLVKGLAAEEWKIIVPYAGLRAGRKVKHGSRSVETWIGDFVAVSHWVSSGTGRKEPAVHYVHLLLVEDWIVCFLVRESTGDVRVGSLVEGMSLVRGWALPREARMARHSDSNVTKDERAVAMTYVAPEGYERVYRNAHGRTASPFRDAAIQAAWRRPGSKADGGGALLLYGERAPLGFERHWKAWGSAPDRSYAVATEGRAVRLPDGVEGVLHPATRQGTAGMTWTCRLLAFPVGEMLYVLSVEVLGKDEAADRTVERETAALLASLRVVLTQPFLKPTTAEEK